MQKAPPSAQPLLPVSDEPKARDSLSHRIATWLSPKTVDSVIAGVSLALGGLFLHTIDLAMGTHAIPLFAAPILPSSVIFFGGPSPPPVKGFLLCTVGAWVAGFAIKYAPFENGSELCVAAGLLLIFFKLSGNFFVPSVGLSVFLVADPTGVMAQPIPALKFLIAPWMAGHAFMYGLSHLISKLRSSVRTKLSKAKFAAKFSAEAAKGDEALKEIFYRALCCPPPIPLHPPCASLLCSSRVRARERETLSHTRAPALHLWPLPCAQGTTRRATDSCKRGSSSLRCRSSRGRR
jgi:hypothetical protein